MKHFSFDDFAKSELARLYNIDNSIPKNILKNIKELVEKILDPLYDAWGLGFSITSGYQSSTLINIFPNSTLSSAHNKGYAVDIVPNNGELNRFKEFTMKWLYNNNIAFDLYVDENFDNASFVHISIKDVDGKKLRKQYIKSTNGELESINPSLYKPVASQGNFSAVLNNSTPVAKGITVLNNIKNMRKRNSPIKYIILHYTAGGNSKNGAASGNVKVLDNRGLSSDYVIDDVNILQLADDPAKWRSTAVLKWNSKGTDAGRYATNDNAISIEICSSLQKGDAVPAPNNQRWYFTDAVLTNTAYLCKELIKKYNIPQQNIIRHFDIMGKYCPGIIGWNTGDENNENTYRSFVASLYNGTQFTPAFNVNNVIQNNYTSSQTTSNNNSNDSLPASSQDTNTPSGNNGNFNTGGNTLLGNTKELLTGDAIYYGNQIEDIKSSSIAKDKDGNIIKDKTGNPIYVSNLLVDTFGNPIKDQDGNYISIDFDNANSNNIFAKDNNGDLIINENGSLIISDLYLLEITEADIDTLNDISDIPAYTDPNLEAFYDVLSEISSSNIELVGGISYNPDGSYAIKQNHTLKLLMAMVLQWWHMVLRLKSIDFSDLNNFVEETENEDGTTSINAMVYMKAAFDMYGRAYRLGMTCPICGKRARYLPPGGYCSTECLLKAAKNKSLAFLMAPNDKYKSLLQTVNQLYGILKQTNLIINAMVMIPDIVKELDSFPIEYRKFVLCKIAEGFADLLELIQKAMILKTKLLQNVLKPINTGVISKPVATGMQAINLIVLSLLISLEAFLLAYDSVKLIIDKLSVLNMPPGLVIPAQSHAWALTPRSFLSPLDGTKIFVNLPGAANSAFPSSLTSINPLAIDAIIQNMFPPLTPADYYLEPELFKIRYLFSDLSDLVSSVILLLEDYMRFGVDYIPAYENLFPVKKYTIDGKDSYLPNFAYIWFVLGLLDSWSPHSVALVGNIFNPAT